MNKIILFCLSLILCSQCFSATLENCSGKKFCFEFSTPPKNYYLPWYSVTAGILGSAILGLILSEQNRTAGAMIGTAGAITGIMIAIPMNANEPINVTVP